MKFVLILWALASNGDVTALSTADFDNRTACLVALDNFRNTAIETGAERPFGKCYAKKIPFNPNSTETPEQP